MSKMLPRTTPLMDALETMIKRAFDLPVNRVREVNDAQNCRPDRLASLAWERQAPVWDPDWSEEKRRGLVGKLLQHHQWAGTPGQIHAALRAFIGSHIEVRLVEWWQAQPQGSPYTFTAQNNLAAAHAAGVVDDLEQIRAVIQATKPRTRHFELSQAAPSITRPRMILAARTYSVINATATCVWRPGLRTSAFAYAAARVYAVAKVGGTL